MNVAQVQFEAGGPPPNYLAALPAEFHIVPACKYPTSCASVQNSSLAVRRFPHEKSINFWAKTGVLARKESILAKAEEPR